MGTGVIEAERAGFDTLWFSDRPSLAATDPLVGVAFATARTSRVKLGVNIVPFGYEPSSSPASWPNWIGCAAVNCS